MKCQLKDVEEGEGKNIAVELRGEPPVEPELVQACRECDNKDEILFFVFVFQFLIFCCGPARRATTRMRGSVAVSIKQRESSPCRTEGREVLAGQYLEVIMVIVQMQNWASMVILIMHVIEMVLAVYTLTM